MRSEENAWKPHWRTDGRKVSLMVSHLSNDRLDGQTDGLTDSLKI